MLFTDKFLFDEVERKHARSSCSVSSEAGLNRVFCLSLDGCPNTLRPHSNPGMPHSRIKKPKPCGFIERVFDDHIGVDDARDADPGAIQQPVVTAVNHPALHPGQTGARIRLAHRNRQNPPAPQQRQTGLLEPEADLQLDLEVRHLAIGNMTTCLDDLEPVKMLDGLAGTLDRRADRVFNAHLRRSRQFDQLVDMFRHDVLLR